MTQSSRPIAALSVLAVIASITLLPAPAGADPGGIKGQDVMGDKSRSANEGWGQAPVPREQSAAKDVPNPGAQSTTMNGDRPVPKAGQSGGDGADPRQTLEHRMAQPVRPQSGTAVKIGHAQSAAAKHADVGDRICTQLRILFLRPFCIENSSDQDGR